MEIYINNLNYKDYTAVFGDSYGRPRGCWSSVEEDI